jgi:hypothetical protein
LLSYNAGASFILLPHDIWGTDHANSSTVWPGDNGDWSNYDAFLNRLIADIKSNNMIPGLVFDICNEPDLPNVFWQRTIAQYLALYVRTHKRLRYVIPNPFPHIPGKLTPQVIMNIN